VCVRLSLCTGPFTDLGELTVGCDNKLWLPVNYQGAQVGVM
jgi:hypothetical protein